MFDSFPRFIGVMLIPFGVSLAVTLFSAGRFALSKSYFLLFGIVSAFVVALIATAVLDSAIMGSIIGAVVVGLIMRYTARRLFSG